MGSVGNMKHNRIRIVTACLSLSLLGAGLFVPRIAAASTQVCGTSGGHTVCFVDVPATLSGEQAIKVTASPNSDQMFFQWIPDVGASQGLLTDFAPNPLTGDYTFVWPTQKYLDGSGTLKARSTSLSANPVSIGVTLSNGNVSDYQHSPNDWATYLPGGSANTIPDPWTSGSDPVIAAVGDGVSGKQVSENVISSIEGQNPAMVLNLGDVYPDGTATTFRNHSGQPDLGGDPGTSWGKMWTITQSVIGNHEWPLAPNWDDYWHQHPEYYTFTFAHTLFIGLSSNAKVGRTSAQYKMTQSALATNTLPCVVAFWHIPALLNSDQNPGVITNKSAVWKLLTDNGGDIVLNGHVHTMIEYKPMNDALQLPAAGEPTMVQLVSGAGGAETSVGAATPDNREAWTIGQTPGSLFFTLNGAANGGTPNSITWTWRDSGGTLLRTGPTRSC